jgi:outer membrane protein TolC
MRISILLIVFAFSFGLSGYGQTSLTDLVNYTLEHSRDVKKSELKYEESGYMYKEARGHGLPQVEASASYSKMVLPDMGITTSADQINGMLDMIINESVSAESRQNLENSLSGMLGSLSSLDALYTASAGIQITQLLYSQSYWVGLKTARKTQELYSILKTQTEEDVIAEVATGYYQAGSLMLQLQTVDKSINNLNEIHRIAEASYKNDMLKESSVNRLKVTISNLEVTRQTIKNGIDIQLNYLKALAGMPGDSLLVIDTATLVNDYVNTVSANFSVENVSSYQMLLKQNEVYGQQVKLSRATYFPTLAAFAKINYSSYNTSAEISDFSNMNTFGLSLSFPIFTSGVNHYKVKQTKLKQFQLQQDILKTKDLLTVNYNNAYLEYQTSRDLLAAQKENKELALKVYNQTSMQYQEGMASLADLLNVNSDFLQADNSFNQQILKCKTSEIKMLKASGNLKSIVNKK